MDIEVGFIKSAIPTAIELVLRALTTIVLLKMIAVYGDSHAVALLGQFQNIFLVCALLGGGLMSNGIISLTSDLARQGVKSLHDFWNFSLSFVLSLSSFWALLLIVFSGFISENFFDGLLPKSVVVIMGVLLIPFCLQNVFVSILNGIEKPLLLAASRLSASIFMLIFFFIILKIAGVSYSLLALVVGPASVVVVSYFILHRNNLYKKSHFSFTLKNENSHRIFHYGVMAAMSTASLPLLQLFVRTKGINLFGVEDVGVWDGVFRLFDQFLAFITSILSVYFLPQLVRTKDLLKTTLKMLILGLGAGLALSLVFLLFHERIIELFLSQKFVITREWMFLITLTGLFKVLGWIFSYALVAKGQTKSYIACEILFLITGIVCYLSTYSIGPQALIFAFLGGYVVYSITCAFFYRRLLKRL